MVANQNLRKKKILIIISSILITVLGIAALVSGAVIMYLNTQNDFEGYAVSESYTVDTSANAFVLWVGSPVSEARLKWIITSTDSNREIFAGWGAASTVNTYTRDYQYATPQSGWGYHARAYYAAINISSTHIINQNSPALPPPQESIYLNTVTTSDSTTLYCTPNNEGDKMGMLVIMNADGSSGVKAEIQLGSRVPMYGWLPYILIPVGIGFLVTGLLIFIRRTKQRPLTASNP